VLKSAPENLAAIRGLAEIHHRKGELAEALVQYRAALSLARNDPDLEQTVGELTLQLGVKKRPDTADGLSLAQMQQVLLTHQPAAPVPTVPEPEPEPAPERALEPGPETPSEPVPEEFAEFVVGAAPAPVAESVPEPVPEPLPEPEPSLEESVPEAALESAPPPPAPISEPEPMVVEDPARIHALRTIDALQHFLDDIHVASAERRA
jgi:hypothetical protein